MIVIEKGADRTVRLIVFESNEEGAPISIKTRASAAAGATAVTIERLAYALADGDMLMTSDNMVVTVSGAHAIGVATLNCSALPGALKNGEVLRKLQDLTGYTIEGEVLAHYGDVTPVIPAANLSVSIPNQASEEDRGNCFVTFEDTDTDAIASGVYNGAFWRRDAGNERPLLLEAVEIKDAGFQ